MTRRLVHRAGLREESHWQRDIRSLLGRSRLSTMRDRRLTSSQSRECTVTTSSARTPECSITTRRTSCQDGIRHCEVSSSHLTGRNIVYSERISRGITPSPIPRYCYQTIVKSTAELICHPNRRLLTIIPSLIRHHRPQIVHPLLHDRLVHGSLHAPRLIADETVRAHQWAAVPARHTRCRWTQVRRLDAVA